MNLNVQETWWWINWMSSLSEEEWILDYKKLGNTLILKKNKNKKKMQKKKKFTKEKWG